MKIVKRSYGDWTTDSRLCNMCNRPTDALFALQGDSFKDMAKCARCFVESLVADRREVEG